MYIGILEKICPSTCMYGTYIVYTLLTVHPQNVGFQNVRFTKRQVYKTSGFKRLVSKRPVFKFDILTYKTKRIGIAKSAFLFKVKSVSFLLITSNYGDIWQKNPLK
jgi:hypothetical protein